MLVLDLERLLRTSRIRLGESAHPGGKVALVPAPDQHHVNVGFIIEHSLRFRDLSFRVLVHIHLQMWLSQEEFISQCGRGIFLVSIS